jgi:hypothetical protein
VSRLLVYLLLLLGLAGASFTSPAVYAAASFQGTELSLKARPAYEGVFRVGTWLPVMVEVENAGIDRRVQVRVGTREGAQYSTEFDLPHNSRKLVTVYTYMSPAARRLVVRLVADGQELASQTLQLPPANPRAHIVGFVTAAGTSLRAPIRLPDRTSLLSVSLAPADMPTHALGLSGLDTIVFEDVAPAELSAAQLSALSAWVLRGGQLVLAGSDLVRTLAGLPPSLLPATVDAVDPLPDAELPGSPATGAVLPLARLSPQSDAVGRMSYAVPLAGLSLGGPAALEQEFGRGSITVMALPLGHPALVSWQKAPDLWADLLRPASELPPGFTPDALPADSFIEGNLATSLTSLPALEFPPLGLLIGLVAAYIFLVGPGSYLLLRRLDRQALGWIVVPGLTLVFAALTYSLGYAQRGGDVVLNQVVLIEPDEHGMARIRSFVGLFSPVQRAYSLDVADTSNANTFPLLRPLSLQGPWDNAGMNADGLFVQDVAPGAQARDFTVAQWAMRALTSDTTAALDPIVARLYREGERLVGEVDNSSTLSLRDVTLIQGNRFVRLGDIAPGASLSGELRRPSDDQINAFGPHMSLSYLLYGRELDQQHRPGGQPLAPELQQRIRILDTLFSYGPVTRGGQPLLLAWADTNALHVSPDVARVSQQQVALVMLTPRLEFDPGVLTLEQGWLTPRFESSVGSACFGPTSPGVSLGVQPAVLQLHLPRDLYGLQLRELTLLTSSDGPWPKETLVELYDWESGAWQAQTTSTRRASVAEPARYLGSHGLLRVRVSGPAGQGGFNCVYVDALMTGELPREHTSHRDD